MNKLYYRIVGVLMIIIASSCSLDGDLENPNEVSLANADVDLLMNGIQLDFADYFNELNNRTAPLVRQQAMTGGYRYQNAILPQGMDLLWTLAYQNILVNIHTMLPIAQEKNLTTHVAIGKILEAYVYLSLVDVFGDVPRTNALKGPDGEFNPTSDGGESVYDYALSLLTEARTELAKTGLDAGAAIERDIYYAGDREKWNTLANTLEFKALMNLSMVPARKAAAEARIVTILDPASDINIIDEPSESFTYKYGTATVPVSRHPMYNQYYGPSEASAGGYIANYFLYELFNGRGVQDPRWRYYFYRQVGSIATANDIDPKSVGCEVGAIPDHYANGDYVFCTFDPGFYGRDHGDASGTPPDSPVITCAGVYPAGGRIDNTLTSDTDYAEATVRGDGANGAGIQPIWMAFYTDYLRAEFLARTNDADAEATLYYAIQRSLEQIKGFASSRGQTLPPGVEPLLANYLTAVNSAYDGATDKIDVVGREFYVATWGNGLEAYNLYRRTSAPGNFQPTLQLNPGPFFRSIVYPAAHVNLNSSTAQKDVSKTNKVFWDTNPDDLQ
jgi:hypothetical protein